jgi:hypothetical protein
MAHDGKLSRRQALQAGAVGMAALLGMGPLSAEALAELRRLAQGEPMTGVRLVGILQDERAEWNALLAQVGLERMEELGVVGDWSVKELVAHLTWYERAIVENGARVLQGEAFVRPADRGEMVGLNMDERNALVAEKARVRSTTDVLAEADSVYQQLLAMIAAVPDRILNDASVLGLPDDIPPWMRVANNSYSHYREHAADLRAWLQRAKTAV